MKQKTKAYADVQLLQREYVNFNKFRVRFTRMPEHETYVLQTGKALGPAVAFCEPDDFLYLPHGYYVIEGLNKDGSVIPKGEPIHMLMNLEKAMFKGNKIPSNHYGLEQ